MLFLKRAAGGVSAAEKPRRMDHGGRPERVFPLYGRRSKVLRKQKPVCDSIRKAGAKRAKPGGTAGMILFPVPAAMQGQVFLLGGSQNVYFDKTVAHARRITCHCYKPIV